MSNDYKKQAIYELVEEIKTVGFRVFIAKSATHGFFTNADGQRIVSFQYDLGSINYSGNYTTDQPRITGTGWRIAKVSKMSINEIFTSFPPFWATGQSKWNYTTLAQYLATYQRSSQYYEVA